MNWVELEKSFARALRGIWSVKKALVVWPALCFCGFIVTFFRAASLEASPWLSLYFLFFSFFVSSAILFGIGTLLVRMHALEVRGEKIDLKKLCLSGWPLLSKAALLSLPPMLLSICLWMTLGIFFLLQSIPVMGSFFSVVFSFAPFLLFAVTLALLVLNGIALFLAPAWVVTQPVKAFDQIKSVCTLVLEKPLSFLVCLGLSWAPVLASVWLLTKALGLTEMSFPELESPLLRGFQSFFLMPVFAALLTPATVFFFNFSLESYHLLKSFPQMLKSEQMAGRS